MNWFTIFPKDEDANKATYDAQVEFFARKREDGRVDVMGKGMTDPLAWNAKTEVRTAESMKLYWRVGTDAQGTAHSVGSKTGTELNRIWDYQTNRNMVNWIV